MTLSTAAKDLVLDRLPPEISRYFAEKWPSVTMWGDAPTGLAQIITSRLPRSKVFAANFTADPPSTATSLVLDQLQRVEQPLSMLGKIVAKTQHLCVISVPDSEYPLAADSRSQFRPESFPEYIGIFRLIHRATYVEPERGPMLLAVYASAAMAQELGRSARVDTETEKWNDYYAGLGEAFETPALRTFGDEFVGVVGDLLPTGGDVLEAGCGAGFQSLALARDGRFRTQLLDVSDQALAAAKVLFARNGLAAEMAAGDVFATGLPSADLVFNAGVLEHYTVDQQAGFLRGMASRSRRYVLVLVPNRKCYWYWLWRIRAAAAGDWSFGKECPTADLSAAFEKAGLTFIGHRVLGATWTEDLIGYIQGMDDELRRDVLAIHRSLVMDQEQKGYLIAALGCIGSAPVEPLNGWSEAAGDDPRLAEVTATLADHTALHLQMDQQHRKEIWKLNDQRYREHEDFHKQIHVANEELVGIRKKYQVANDELYDSRQMMITGTYRLAAKMVKLRQRILPTGSRRLRFVKAILSPVRWVLRRPAVAHGIIQAAAIPGFGNILAAVAASKLRPIVFLPSIPWTSVLFQRPQHLARELALLGHVVIYDCSGTDEPLEQIREVEPGVFLYKGPVAPLAKLPDPALWAFSYNYKYTDAFPERCPRVYDWIDDLAVFPYDQQLLATNHARGLAEAAVVASVARKLHAQASAVRPDAVYLPNAAEVDRFADVTVQPADDSELDAFLAGNVEGVAGYYGALAAWFDYDLLKGVAEKLPNWRFVLIGPDYDGSLRLAHLEACPNVRWLGPRSYLKLPGYLKRFDVATIPFLINDITLATSPLKLFEYFSASRPVVTTPMPECTAFPEVRIADSVDTFVAALIAAKQDGQSPAIRERLLELGRANAWDARAKQVSVLLSATARNRR